MTKIVCISDTHTHHRDLVIPDGDIIVCAGDISYRGTEAEVIDFLAWYDGLPHKHKILIAGNHDWLFEKFPGEAQCLIDSTDIIYLNDTSVEVEGIKFHGSPVQPEFCNWAFNRARTAYDAIHAPYEYEFIGKHWNLIPNDTDVLITHGPPAGILDRCPQSVGCHELLKAVDKVRPRYHIFGHIHGQRGQLHLEKINCTFINASSLDDGYRPYKRPAEVIDYD